MKSFFEEYGFVLLAAVVVVGLIAMTTTVKSTISTNVNGLVSSFTNQVSEDLDLSIAPEE